MLFQFQCVCDTMARFMFIILLIYHFGWTLDKVKFVECKTPWDFVCPTRQILANNFVLIDNGTCIVKNLSDVFLSVINSASEISNKSVGSSTSLHNVINKTSYMADTNVTNVTNELQTSSQGIVKPPILENFMSQFHVPATPYVHNDICRNHSLILLDRVQQFDVQALKMLDSSGKIPSGILNGNVNQYGDFDQCLGSQVKLDPQEFPQLKEHIIQGKYCLANVDVNFKNSRFQVLKKLDDLINSFRPFNSSVDDAAHRVARFSTINWGFCMPSSCTADDLSTSLKEALETQIKDTGITMKVKVDPRMCYVQENKPLTLETKLTVLFFMFLIGLVVIRTCLDKGDQHAYEGQKSKLMQAFSLRRNFRTLMQTDTSSNEIGSVHGIRALNALALLMFHKSTALYFNPYVNRTDMAMLYAMSWSVIGRTASIYTDAFLTISGLLTSISLLKELERRNKINFWRTLASRYMRFTPSLLSIILFCTYISIHLGSGPQWNLVVKHHSDICQKNMWQNLLYIHNYFGFEDMCLTNTHHLGIDFQLSLLAPVFVYWLWRSHRIGLYLVGLTVVLSTVLRYVAAYYNNLRTVIIYGIPVAELYKFANMSYTLPSHRLSVYLIGVAVGYALHQNKGVILSKTQVLIGWLASIILALFAMIGPYHMSYPDYEYNAHENALYNALGPICWAAAHAWFVIADSYGYAGFFGKFLSWKGFKIFTRISYAVYLIQFHVYFYNVGTRRTPGYYTSSVLLEVGEVSAVLLFSVILTLLVDLPFQEIKKCLWKEGSRITGETKDLIENEITEVNNGIETMSQTHNEFKKYN